MDVFELRRPAVADYQEYVTSFISIRDPLIQAEVDENLDAGMLWPEPWIGLNPSFETGGLIDEHGEAGLLDQECSKIFRIKPEGEPEKAVRLHRHQLDAIKARHWRELRADDRYRVRKEPQLHHSGRSPCASQRERERDQGDHRRLSR